MLEAIALLAPSIIAPVIVASPAAGPQDPAAPWRLSLEEAVRTALASNLDLAIAAELERSDVELARAAWGSFDPLLSFGANYADSEIEASSFFSGAAVVEVRTERYSAGLLVPLHTGGSFDFGFDRERQRTNSQFANEEDAFTDTVALTYVQPLLRGAWSGYAESDERQLELAAQQEAWNARALRHVVTRDVHRAYWNLHAAREALAVRELALRLAREQLAQEEKRLAVGVGTEVDVLQAETNVARRSEELIAAAKAEDAAADALRTLLGVADPGAPDSAERWERPIEPTDALPEPLAGEALAARANWSAAVARALERRPELAASRLTIEQARLDVSERARERLATLDLTLDARATAFDESSSAAFQESTGFDFPTFSAGLVYSYPLGNETAVHQERAARAALRVSELELDKLELAIVAEVRDAAREFAHQADAVAAARKSAELAERQLAAEQERQSEGLSTTFQVLEFQSQLAEALLSTVNARAAYARAQAQLAWSEAALPQ